MMDADHASPPPQEQDHQPGRESEMRPAPDFMPRYPGSGRLAGKVALISGGDSGIGRAVAVLFAREGAKIAIIYIEEVDDAKATQDLIEAEGSAALCIEGDIGDETFCRRAVKMTVERFGGLDVLVNNAAEQHSQPGLEDVSAEQLERTIWTPLTPATYDAEHVGEFGQKAPMGRPGQPNEVAPSHLFLACEDSSYMTGQVLHPNGGDQIAS